MPRSTGQREHSIARYIGQWMTEKDPWAGVRLKRRCPAPPHNQSANFQASLSVTEMDTKENPDEVLCEFVKSLTKKEELQTWRRGGRTLLQECVCEGYWRSLESLFLSPYGCPEDIPDSDGNYSVHLAAKEGQIRVAAFLAARLPERNFLKKNNQGENVLMLAAVSLKLKWVSNEAKEHFFDILDLTPDDMLEEALTSTTTRGKNVFEILVDDEALFWLYATVKLLRNRENGENFLCLTGWKGRNIAHFLSLRETDWGMRSTYLAYSKRRGLTTPSWKQILDALPDSLFGQTDSSGKAPWHYAVNTSLVLARPNLLTEFLIRTPYELRFDPIGRTSPAQVLHRVVAVITHHHINTLEQLLEELPPGTADEEPVSGLGPAIFTAIGRKWSGIVVRTLCRYMTEDGLLRRKNGETFVHTFVRTLSHEAHDIHAARAPGDFVNFLRNEIAEKVDLRQLLNVRNRSGKTACELATTYLPGLAKCIHVGGAKRAF